MLTVLGGEFEARRGSRLRHQALGCGQGMGLGTWDMGVVRRTCLHIAYRFRGQATASVRPQGHGSLERGMRAVTLRTKVEALREAAKGYERAAVARLWSALTTVK
jgi:hypothetical protein